MTMNVLIVGGGKVGGSLAALLLENGHQVRVIEDRPEALPRLRRDLPAEVIVIGSGAAPAVLEAAGIRGAHVVAAVTGQDETNLVVTNLARFEFNVPRVIARVNDPKNAWLFTPEMGVDAALNQAELMARLIAEEMSLGDMLVLFKLRRGQYALVEEKVHPQAAAVGQALGALVLPEGCSVVAVLRGGELLPPAPTLTLAPADEVLAVARPEPAAALAALLGERQTNVSP